MRKEKINWVVGHGKLAHADSIGELVGWGRGDKH